jgi:methylmalonyl-CoA/ethylmalonyl-CoA epimerase
MEKKMHAEVDHIAIALSDLEKGLQIYRDLLGLEHHHTEVVEEQKVKAAMLTAGATRIELVEPTAPDSPIARFLAKKGEGLHHIAFRIKDLESVLARLKKAGARLIDEEPRQGVGGTRIAFLHPSATAGVLVELVESP